MQTSPTPWYKQFWPWFLLSIPLASIILSSIMVTVAVSEPPAMVSDDYYKDGLNININISKDQEASRMAVHARLSMDSADGTLVVSLAGKLPPHAYPYLVLNLEHPTLAEKDQTLRLEPVDPTRHRYVVHFPAPIAGNRYLTITSSDNVWRLIGPVSFPFNNAVLESKHFATTSSAP